jgi:ATP-binding cassette subfamily A (ABC1) protein 3
LTPSYCQVSEAAAELAFILPSTSISQFPQLFDSIEANKTKLGISSYGLSVTTMEEVFMKVGEESTRLDGLVAGDPAEKYRRPEEETEVVRMFSLEGDQEVQEATVSLEPVESVATYKANQGAVLDGEIRPSLILDEEEVVGTTIEAEEPYAINSGIVLWFQQFCAMFIKRALNAIRHIPALVFQLVLPAIFVLLGVGLLLVFRSPLAQDEPRQMTLALSLPVTGGRRMFYGDLRSASDLAGYFENSDFQFSFTEMLNVSMGVRDIMNRVLPIGPGNMSACCNYNYQILDKYCASQRTSVYNEALGQCTSNSNFGYRNCLDCLSCCTSSGGITCPSPPQVQFSLTGNSGLLDTSVPYVDERLLEVGSGAVNEYEQEMLLGFTVDADLHPSIALCLTNATNISSLLSTISGTSSNLPNFPTSSSNSSGSSTMANNTNSFGSSASLLRPTTFCRGTVVTPFAQTSFSSPTASPPNSTVTVWYSNEYYHIAPTALNTFYNYYLRRVAATYNTTNALTGITVTNHPLPRTVDGELDQLNRVFAGFSLSFFLSFGYAFLLASFVLFVAQERSSKAKHLQFVGGVHISSFWLATFLWDLLNCLPSLILSLILIAAFQVEELTGPNLGVLTLLLIFLYWSGIPLIYCFSFLFNNHLVAFSASVAFVFFIPQVCSLVRLFVSFEDTDAGEVLDYIFMIFPTYAFNRGLENVYLNEVQRSTCTRDDLVRRACEQQGIQFYDSALDSVSPPGVGASLVFMGFEGILLFILTVIIERGFFIHEIIGMFGCRKHKQQHPQLREGEDIDVANEREKINSKNTNGDVVVIQNLAKTYHGELTNCWRRKKVAVDEICLGIHKQECFGLLGVNGAGKTSTFNMLTGDLRPSGGTALIAGYDILTQLRKVQQRIGYCPQFDALLERMTGEELLTMFCRLRGIPEKKIPHVVKTEIKRLDLEKYAKKRCGTYSGGNKRKLSTAIALVGSPPIILLDEPTTGMDPNARRHLWNALTELVAVGKSIVLTSHSMEECEALCTRLAIMVNGEFKSLGSAQHLKNKFGEGLTLVVKTNPAAGARGDLTSSTILSNSSAQGGLSSLSRSSGPTNQIPPNLVNFINQTFPGSVLLESHQGSTTYQLPSEGLSWSFILQQIEENKAVLGIEDYSISQTTLEQVFLTFAQEQLED